MALGHHLSVDEVSFLQIYHSSRSTTQFLGGGYRGRDFSNNRGNSFSPNTRGGRGGMQSFGGGYRGRDFTPNKGNSFAQNDRGGRGAFSPRGGRGSPGFRGSGGARGSFSEKRKPFEHRDKQEGSRSELIISIKIYAVFHCWDEFLFQTSKIGGASLLLARLLMTRKSTNGFV